MRVTTFFAIFAVSAVHVRAQVVSSEFVSDPVSEGWDLVQQYCDPETWNDNGQYHQALDFEACGPPPGGGQDSYVREIHEMNGISHWFYEFRVSTTGDRSEIPGGAPSVLVAFNSFGDDYTATVASDQVKLFRDATLPILFFDIEPGIPHVIRVELNNEGTPTYRWFIDGVLADEGEAEDVFPSDNSRITWRGKAWFLPCENSWDYIRYGVIPEAGSGDFDSDFDLDLRDYRYFAECAADSGAGVDAGPGCVWADMDGDSDVDLIDFGLFQAAFTGS